MWHLSAEEDEQQARKDSAIITMQRIARGVAVRPKRHRGFAALRPNAAPPPALALSESIGSESALARPLLRMQSSPTLRALSAREAAAIRIQASARRMHVHMRQPPVVPEASGPPKQVEPERANFWLAWIEARRTGKPLSESSADARAHETEKEPAEAAAAAVRLLLPLKSAASERVWSMLQEELSGLLALQPAQLSLVELSVQVERNDEGGTTAATPFSVRERRAQHGVGGGGGGGGGGGELLSRPRTVEAVVFDLLPSDGGLPPRDAAATLACMIDATSDSASARPNPLAPCEVLIACVDARVPILINTREGELVPAKPTATKLSQSRGSRPSSGASPRSRPQSRQPSQQPSRPPSRPQSRAAPRKVDESAIVASALLECVRMAVPDAPDWMRSALLQLAVTYELELDGSAEIAPPSGDRAPPLPRALWRALGLCDGRALRALRIRALSPSALAHAQLTGLSQLQELQLNCLGLASLPDLSGCVLLQHVDVSENMLDSDDLVPELIATLPSLRALNLSRNNLRSLHAMHAKTEMRADAWMMQGQIESCPPIELLAVSENEIKEIGSSISCLRKLRALDVRSNRLESLPLSLVDLESHSLETLLLDDNAAAPSQMLLQARLSGGVYVSIEMCTAPRPSVSLKGDSARYHAAFAELHYALTLRFSGAVPVVLNTTPSETAEVVSDEPRSDLDQSSARSRVRLGSQSRAPSRPVSARPQPQQGAAAARRFPRLGALEVVARTHAGSFVSLHSKMLTKRFPSVDAVVNKLLGFLGQKQDFASEQLGLYRRHFFSAIADADAPTLHSILRAAPYLAFERDEAGIMAIERARECGQLTSNIFAQYTQRASLSRLQGMASVPR